RLVALRMTLVRARRVLVAQVVPLVIGQTPQRDAGACLVGGGAGFLVLSRQLVDRGSVPGQAGGVLLLVLQCGLERPARTVHPRVVVVGPQKDGFRACHRLLLTW